MERPVGNIYGEVTMYARDQAFRPGQGWPVAHACSPRQPQVMTRQVASTHMEVWDTGPFYRKQKSPALYDGSTSWSAYLIQFEMSPKLMAGMPRLVHWSWPLASGDMH